MHLNSEYICRQYSGEAVVLTCVVQAKERITRFSVSAKWRCPLRVNTGYLGVRKQRMAGWSLMHIYQSCSYTHSTDFCWALCRLAFPLECTLLRI